MKKKTIIYQLMPRWFTNTHQHCVANADLQHNGVGKLNEIDSTRLGSIKSLGATHVWYTGIIEHATATDYSHQGITRCNPHIVKGLAGSPYAIKDYYDIDPDLAENVEQRMHEFEALVNRTHQAGLKVIIDFVPNHVAREYGSDTAPKEVQDLGKGDCQDAFFSPNNNFYYITGQALQIQDVEQGDYYEFPARATGNDCYTASPGRYDWYETVKLNYGIDPRDGSQHFSPIPSTWHKMLHILQYWADKGIDGFRCDMAHMVPVAFWQWAISRVKSNHPHLIFIAEIYDVALYDQYVHQAGFDYLYDKVTLYDTLHGILTSGWRADSLTHCWQTVDNWNSHMLAFLENHDEIRLASKYYCGDPFKALPAMTVCATMGRGALMIYAGQELGEPATGAVGYSGDDGRTSIFDYCNVPTLRRWWLKTPTTQERHLRAIYRRLLTTTQHSPALAEGSGFYDLMYANGGYLDVNHHFAFLRHTHNEILLIATNFSDQECHTSVLIPEHALQCMDIHSPCQCSVSKRFQVQSTPCLDAFTLDGHTPFPIHLGAWDAAIWQLSP